MPVAPFKLSIRSRVALKLVDPQLVAVVQRAIELTTVDFRVTEGARTLATQRAYVARGASKTLNSRHIPANNESGLAEAVDIVPLVDGVPKWNLCGEVAKAFYSAAREIGVGITWGGEWKKFPDGPHFELKRKLPRSTSAREMARARADSKMPHPAAARPLRNPVLRDGIF